jgi:PAS domain S-box-containing protein
LDDRSLRRPISATLQQYERLVESIPATLWEADPRSFDFSFVSQHATGFLGHPEEHWLTPGFWVDHLHPADRDRVVAARERRVREGRNHADEYRMIVAEDRTVWVRDLMSVIVDDDGVTKLLGVIVDITERKQAEEERLSHLWFLEGMDRVNRAILGTHDVEQMMRGVLDAVLTAFDCDQAGLLYPCDPGAGRWFVSMFRSRSGFSDALPENPEMPRTPDAVRMIEAVCASDGPVRFGAEGEHPLPDVSAPSGIQSMLAMAVHPKGAQSYLFGLAQARFARVWTPQEERLFEEVGHRVADALTVLLTVRKLRDSEARLDEAANLAHLGYWENDLDTDRIVWSAETLRILGLPPDMHAPTVRDLMERIHPEDRERQAEATARSRRDGKYDAEYRIVRPDGEVRTIHSVGDVIRDESGRPRRGFGVVQDITERKRAEGAAAESLNLLNAIVEGTSDAIFVKDLEGRYLLMNAAGARSRGKPHELVVGNRDVQLFPPDEARAIVDRDRQVLASGESQTFEETFTAAGVARTFVTTKSVYRDASGKAIGLVGISSDITEMKRLEEQFRQAQKMEAVGRLAGGVAHDFNNLLTVINASSAMLLDDAREDDPSRELLSEIREAGDRAATLTRQLLAFSRKQVLQPRIVDLNALLSELLKLLQRLIGEDVETTLVEGATLGLTEIDPGQFEQAIINLAVNARDAMPLGGRLTIETRNADLSADDAEPFAEVHAGPYVLVSVSDSGHGMDETTKARIFEPFFTTKGPGEGTGLGLAMVYGFIKQSGGHIEVSSDVDQGTTFRIYLPRSAVATPTARLSPASHERPAGTETVLLVEDEEAVRRLANRVLQSSGYTVLEARNGEAAITVAQEHSGPIHILVTDLVMPRMSGRQLASSMAQARPRLRVLFMSGYTEQAVLRPDGLDPSVAFLQKPFSPSELARKVREVLDRHDAHRA